MRRLKPLELALPQRLLHGLPTRGSGHVGFAANHRRFHNEDANLTSYVGRRLLLLTSYAIEDIPLKCLTIGMVQA